MNCDRIARLYVIGERLVFGRALDRCRTRSLSALAPHRAALVCGDGDGRFLAALLQSDCVQQVDAIDVSRRMTTLAERRVGCRRRENEPARVEFFCADIRTFVSTRTYDLIATHFFLDCFDEREIRSVVHRIARLADANATWIVSEFQVPAQGLARHLGSIAISGLYATFRVLTGLRVRRLPDYRAALAECGFVEVSDLPSWGGLLSSQIWRRSSAGPSGVTQPHARFAPTQQEKSVVLVDFSGVPANPVQPRPGVSVTPAGDATLHLEKVDRSDDVE